MNLNRRSFFATLIAAPAVAAVVPAAIAAPTRIATKATAQALPGISARFLIDSILIQIGVLLTGEVAAQHDAEYALDLLNEIVMGDMLPTFVPPSHPSAIRPLTLESIIPLEYCWNPSAEDDRHTASAV